MNKKPFYIQKYKRFLNGGFFSSKVTT